MMLSEIIKKYKWMGYPIFVALLIFISLNFFIGGPNQGWFQLLEKQQKVNADRERLGRLNSKLAVLKQTNVNKVKQDLGWMLSVMPDQKEFEEVVNELRYASFMSNSTLEKYTTGISTGNEYVISVDYLVPDYVSVQKLLGILESSLPILKITDVTYLAPSLKVTVVSGWSPTSSVSVKFDDPLPDYVTTFPILKNSLASYQVPLVISASGSGTPTLNRSTNPFGLPPGSN